MSAPSNSQVLSALVIACVVPAVVASVALLNPLLGIWVAAISLFRAFALGVPLFLLLRKFSAVNLVTAAFSGLLIGALPAYVLLSDVPGQYVPFGAFGLVSGTLFWALVSWQTRARPLPEA